MSNNDYNKVTSSSVSVGNWMWTILLSRIPLVNLILYLVTALHSKKPSKRNWAIGNALLDVLSKIIAGILVVVLCVLLSSTVLEYFETTPVTDFSATDFIIYIAQQYEDEKQPEDDIPAIEDNTDTEDETFEDNFFDSEEDLEDVENIGDIEGIEETESDEEAAPENVG